MKKIICLFLITSAFISCSIDNMPSQNSTLQGKWNWIITTGGIDGDTTTPQSTGKSIKLEITNTKIKESVNGVVVYESNYSIVISNSIYGGKQKIISYGNSPKKSFYLTNSNTQLILKDECYDCYQKTYIKEAIGSN
jgi:hypothetical protein